MSIRVPFDVLSFQIHRRISVISPVEMESPDVAQKGGKTGVAVKVESDVITEKKAAKKGS